MPWKETDVVNLRTEFVLRLREGGTSMAELCREFGISRKTGYKWKARFLEQGLGGLPNRSRRPDRSPGALDEETLCRIVALKLAHPAWGPRKIRAVYSREHPHEELPSESSFKRVLDKAGLVQRRRRRRQDDTGRLSQPVPAEHPNHVWTVDFKGWWRTGDRQRFEPLTVRDAYSRYLLSARALCSTKTEPVRTEFERLFASHGLPAVIRSDNGSPFACRRSPLGLTRLSAWWLALGIDLDRILPARPDQNGSHERMHRDMALELEATAARDVVQQQAALDVWRTEYNRERPHEAIGMRTPAELYENSPRSYQGGELQLEYPLGFLRRRVNNKGMICLERRSVFISEALAGWDVGLQPEEDHYGLWFCRLRLGEVDLQTQKFLVVARGQES